MCRFPKNINNLRFSSLGPNLSNNLDPGGIFSNGSKTTKIWSYSDYCSKPGPPQPARPALAHSGRPGPPTRLARRSLTRRARASNLAPPDLPDEWSWAVILKLDLWPSFILNEKAIFNKKSLYFWTWVMEHWTHHFRIPEQSREQPCNSIVSEAGPPRPAWSALAHPTCLDPPLSNAACPSKGQVQCSSIQAQKQ